MTDYKDQLDTAYKLKENAQRMRHLEDQLQERREHMRYLVEKAHAQGMSLRDIAGYAERSHQTIANILKD